MCMVSHLHLEKQILKIEKACENNMAEIKANSLDSNLTVICSLWHC